MTQFLRQATASQSRTLGPFVDDADGKTAETGLTIANTDIKLMANGGSSANKNSGGGTHRVNGMYGVTFDATDTATVGELEVSVAVAGALPVFASFTVLEEAVYDAIFAASALGYVANAPVNVAQFGGTNGTFASGRPEVNTTHLGGTPQTARDIGASVLLSSGTGTGQVLLSGGYTAVGLLQTGVIVSSTFGAGAINSTAFANDAIAASKFASGTVDKIAAAMLPAGTIYVSTSGNNSNSGANWTQAKLTLAGAVAAVSDGGTIVFGPGTFSFSSGVDCSAKRITLRGQGLGVTTLACTSSSLEMGVWLKGGSVVRDLSITRTGYTGQVMAALRIEGAGLVERVGIQSTCLGLWMYTNAAGDKQTVMDSQIQGCEAGIMFGGLSGSNAIHSNGLAINCAVETKDYTICQSSAIIFQNADGCVINCDTLATYPASKATSATGEGSGPQMPQAIRATEYSRVKVVGGTARCGSLHASDGHHARAIMADLNSSIHLTAVKVTTFSATSDPASLVDLFVDESSELIADDVVYDAAKVSGTIGIAKGAAYTAATQSTAAAASASSADSKATSIKGVTDKLDTALELNSGSYRYTEAALTQAPAGEGGGGFSDTEKAQILAALSVSESIGVPKNLTWVLARKDGDMKATAAIAKDAEEGVDVAVDFRGVLGSSDAIKAADDGGIVSIELLTEGEEPIDSDAFDDVEEATLWMDSAVRFHITGGTAGETYTLRVKVLTVGGNTLTGLCTMKVTGN